MGQPSFASWIADTPQLIVVLFLVINFLLIVYLLWDHRRAKAAMAEEVEERVRKEIDKLTEDSRHINDDARQVLASIALAKAGVMEENASFQQQVEAAKEEIQRTVSEIRSVRQYVTKLTTTPAKEEAPRAATSTAQRETVRENGTAAREAHREPAREPVAAAREASLPAGSNGIPAAANGMPARGTPLREQAAAAREAAREASPPMREAAREPMREPKTAMREASAREESEWSSPEALLRMARQADEWSKTASYLARLDPGTATSRNLESAGDICRDQGFLAKAIEFYRQGMAKDPENCNARAEFLALSAKAHASEREDSLQMLQDLVAQTLGDATRGPAVQGIYFTVMTELGRQREMAAFCEAQLMLPLPRTAQVALHRQLAMLYKGQGKTDDAIAHCDAALKLTGEDVDLLLLHSQLLFSGKNYEEAYRVALRALQDDPTLARSYMHLAVIQEKRMGRPAARELLNKAVQWASAAEISTIEEHLRRMAALDDLSEIVPSTGPQLIRA